MYRQNFRIIFFFNEAKNAGIAYVLARLFNEIEGKKKLKFPIDNCGLVLIKNNCNFRCSSFCENAQNEDQYENDFPFQLSKWH